MIFIRLGLVGTLSVRFRSREKERCRGGGDRACLVLSVLPIFILVSYFSCLVPGIVSFFFSCLPVVLPVASLLGEGIRQRPDGRARQRFYCDSCRPGVFFFLPSWFSLIFV